MTANARSPDQPIDNLAIGTVIEVDGTHIVAELDSKIVELSRVYGGHVYPIGQFGSIVKIHFGRRLIYGYVGRLRMKAEYERDRGIVTPDETNARIVEADLFGEAEWVQSASGDSTTWKLRFDRGVSTFPLPQQTIYLTPRSELGFIFGHGQGPTIVLGEHVGSGGTPCHAQINELLGKHTAILGSTGAGKSAAVAALIHGLLDRGVELKYKKWQPQIVILDPHNEYGRAFKHHQRLSTVEGTLELPYWLLDLQETINLVIGKSEFVATSQVNIVKAALLDSRTKGAQALKMPTDGITVDSPVPYKLSDFKAHVKKQMSELTPSKQDSYNKILNKLDALKNDDRLCFMMKEWDGQKDLFGKIVSQFLGAGMPVRIIDLSGIPNEIAGITSAVVARTLFSLKIWQSAPERDRTPVLLVCEEAHRYVPNSGEVQYEAAQAAIRRVAKEGRKYGLGLILVSQRPSEVEDTVLSQCNSWIIMRITNEADRSYVRSILPDSLAGLTKVLSGLRRREAIFVGQATMLPSRILIRHLEHDRLPKSHDIDFDKAWQSDPVSEKSLEAVGKRWRYQKRPTENATQPEGKA